jgi:hypothetical protein
MDSRPSRPTANPVLRRLDALVGERDMQASTRGREIGLARAKSEPLEGVRSSSSIAAVLAVAKGGARR